VRDGAKIVFEAGVEYRFAADARLEIGWNSNDAEIQVLGSEAAPVVFRGASEEAGFWHGIEILSNVLSSSRIEHARILHGGGDLNPALFVDAPITLVDVTLEDNETGMWLSEEGLDEDSARLSITGTEGAPLTVEPNALVALPRGGSFTDNDADQIVVEGGGITLEGTIYELGVPYFVEGSLSLRTGADITIEAGARFLMNADTQIEVGWNSNVARIVAEGSEEAPIEFLGAQAEAGHWEGIVIRSNVASDSSFTHVEIGHAGGGLGSTANLTLAKAIDVSNCTFFESAGYGLIKDGDDPTDYTTSNVFTDNVSGSVFSD
jgi:hypothetical protein